MIQNQEAPKKIEDLKSKPQNNGEGDIEFQKVEKKYQIISSIIFKYGILALTIIVTITIFFVELQKRKTLSFDNEYEAKKITLVGQYKKDETQDKKYNQQPDLNIILRQGFLNISEDVIQSYNNLINYKGYILPRGTFIYEPNEIKDIEYFKNPDYDISELQKIINKTISINYNEIGARDTQDIVLLPLENNSIENTFFITCANQYRLFNGVCNKYIKEFLNGFFVYKISDDFPGLNKTIKNIMKKKKYKEDACNGLNNYIKYSSTTPSELEGLFSLCGDEYSENFNKTQSFIGLTKELEDKYIKQNVSKYKEINEYKLVSYQQILYNNLENSIPPYEGSYKNYTDYLTNLLKRTSQEPVDSFYYDMTYRFNNQYLIPNLNKIKYQSTQSKRDEIEGIILDIEKINNGNNIEGFVGLKYKLTSNTIEDEVTKIGSNISNNEGNTTMNALLKSIKSLSYLKVINDEITGSNIIINGYLSLSTASGERSPTPFKSILENKKGKLVVNEFSLSVKGESAEINDILKIILQQKDYSISEVYEYVQKNIKIYESNKYNITPCILIMDRLEELNIQGAEILNCDENKINILKGLSGDKTLYQITMDSYQITSIKVTNKDIQSFIDTNLSGIKTNATTITSILPNIIAYEPKKNNNLIGSNDAIIAIDDLKTYLGINIKDIGERSGRVAAEFDISNLSLIGIYDTNTKILGPIYLTGVSIGTGTEKENPKINNFSLQLSQDNQNEINKFLIEPIGYLYELDRVTVSKYLSESLEQYLTKIFDE